MFRFPLYSAECPETFFKSDGVVGFLLDLFLFGECGCWLAGLVVEGIDVAGGDLELFSALGYGGELLLTVLFVSGDGTGTGGGAGFLLGSHDSAVAVVVFVFFV